MKKKEIEIATAKSLELLNITTTVEKVIRESLIDNGICTIFCPHTTAGLAINENADPDVVSDLERALPQVVPQVRFDHMEGNSPSHFLACLIGPSLQVIVENGQPVLGRWQGIFFCEFDGPRRRKIWIKVLED